ncbi:MAG TPA: glycosyltransferase [Candidatus Binataceae bacterium]|nr:glycosyltransferase [Candidatus Binataceae bacterium]
MTITLAIPTHNRASSLARALASLGELDRAAADTIECLVIDNHSTDATAAVVEDFARRAPFATRRIYEPRQGSSFARNRAAREAQGAVVLYIDDDVLVERGWLRAMVTALNECELDVACGLVLPRWEVPPPSWLGPELYGKLAIHEPALSDPNRPRPAPLPLLYSANLAMRRDCFTRFGYFREDLGVFGGHPVGCEDSELFARIIRAGGKVDLVTQAVAYHMIGPERLAPSYLRKKSFSYGLGSAIQGGPTHNRLDKLARNLTRMVAASLRGRPSAALSHQMECFNYLGYWYGRWLMLKQALSRQPPA